jgi:drug/metabolite transporter (DMT)-like permease
VDHVGLLFVRIVLPATIALAGVVLVVFGGDSGRGAGIVLIGVAALVALANVLIRLALQSERDREREQARRQ